MWSNKYNYYNIQNDQFFTQRIETKTVCDILLKTNCFKQKNNQIFSSNDNFPWVDIVLVQTKDGNFGTSNKEIQFVTLIAITCSKGQNIDHSIYESVFSKIAETLNWKLHLEADDDDNEIVEIKRE